MLNVKGQAIALNAGASNQSSQSYYLPLDRILRSLRLLQNNAYISRGTVQVEWEYLPYDEGGHMDVNTDDFSSPPWLEGRIGD